MTLTRVLVLLVSLVLAFCFSAEAALTNQKVQKKALRSQKAASKKLGSHAKMKQSSDESSDDEDDDDDDEDDDVKVDPEKARLEKALADNLRKQEKVKGTLKHLSDTEKSDQEIQATARLVQNETQSPAMASMLSKMWREMRMFEMPSYSQHLQAQLRELKKEEHSVESKLAADSVHSYGNKNCQCVGIDEIEGNTVATLKSGEKVNYPADLGARCEAWDLNEHPKCPGASWCEQKWCYVDPCKCDIPVLPKPTTYIAGAKYQGKPVHFSYATCSGTDSYTAEEDKKTAKDIEATCAVDVDEAKWGAEECRCVGIGPQPGSTKVTIKNKLVDFPADTGATCNKWEEDNHPDCQGTDPPDWCSQAWCYVDPCSCKLAVAPKTSSYLPDSNYQGKPVYYSYATCGGTDAYTGAEHKKACVNQKTSEACNGNKKCAWTGKECLGKELVNVCKFETTKSESAAFGMKALLAFLLPSLGLALEAL